MGISIRATSKRRFVAGLIIVIPSLITFLVIWWLFNFLDGFLEPLYYRILGYHVHGLGFITTIVLIFIVGIISTNVVGRKIIQYFELLILKIPLLKGIFISVKQLVDAFSPESKLTSFKKFVIVEYPRPHVYAYGFLTKECVLSSDRGGGEIGLKAVYIPTNLIYFGDVALFCDEHIYFTNIPIEEGIKIILSGGIATPPKILETRG